MLIYRNVAMVMVATLFLQAAMGALGVALPLAMSGAGWGRPAIGAVIAAFGAGFAIGAWLSPNMIRSVGHIRAYAGYAGGAAALTLLLALGDHFIWWLITRFGFGMCAAGLFAVAESWIADATPSERRGAVISVYQIVGRAGLIAGPFLIALPGFDARDGFIMAGAAMALALTPIVFTKRAQPSLPTGETVPVTRLFSIAPAAAAAAFTAGLLNSGVLGFMPIWAQSLDPEYGAGSAALLMAVIYAGSMLTQWPAGMISDQMDRRLVIAALSIVGGLFALILVVMPNPSLGLAALLVGLWGRPACRISPSRSRTPPTGRGWRSCPPSRQACCLSGRSARLWVRLWRASLIRGLWGRADYFYSLLSPAAFWRPACSGDAAPARP
jgi:MFS family permease